MALNNRKLNSFFVRMASIWRRLRGMTTYDIETTGESETFYEDRDWVVDWLSPSLAPKAFVEYRRCIMFIEWMRQGRQPVRHYNDELDAILVNALRASDLQEQCIDALQHDLQNLSVVLEIRCGRFLDQYEYSFGDCPRMRRSLNKIISYSCLHLEKSDDFEVDDALDFVDVGPCMR